HRDVPSGLDVGPTPESPRLFAGAIAGRIAPLFTSRAKEMGMTHRLIRFAIALVVGGLLALPVLSCGQSAPTSPSLVAKATVSNADNNGQGTPPPTGFGQCVAACVKTSLNGAECVALCRLGGGGGGNQ